MEIKNFDRFIYFFMKTIFFIMTCVVIFLYTKIVYSQDLINKAIINSGLTIPELFLITGIVLGIWLLLSFIILVFVEYKEKEEKHD